MLADFELVGNGDEKVTLMGVNYTLKIIPHKHGVKIKCEDVWVKLWGEREWIVSPDETLISKVTNGLGLMLQTAKLDLNDKSLYLEV